MGPLSCLREYFRMGMPGTGIVITAIGKHLPAFSALHHAKDAPSRNIFLRASSAPQKSEMMTDF